MLEKEFSFIDNMSKIALLKYRRKLLTHYEKLRELIEYIDSKLMVKK